MWAFSWAINTILKAKEIKTHHKETQHYFQNKMVLHNQIHKCLKWKYNFETKAVPYTWKYIGYKNTDGETNPTVTQTQQIRLKGTKYYQKYQNNTK